MRLVLYILLSLVSIATLAQEDRRKVLEGNKSYQANDYASAIKEYERALEVNPDLYEAEFNKADAIYKQDNFEEAAQQFQNLAAKAPSKEKRADAFHNLGNSHLNKYMSASSPENKKEDDLKSAINAYKDALRNNPADNETRNNLARAQKLLQQLQQQQKQDQENKDDKKENEDKKDENEKKEDKENQDQKDKDKDKDKEDQEKKGNEKKEQEKNEEQQKQQQQPKLSKEDAQRLLDAMNNQEKNTQQKLKKKKVKGEPIKIEKDW